MDSYGDMNRVLITDDVDAQCVDMLVGNGFLVEKDIKLAKQPVEQLIKRVQVCSFFCLNLIKHNLFIQEVDILIVRSATKVTSAVIESSPRLKLIGRAGTGTDNIDTEAATRHGILVMKCVVFFFLSFIKLISNFIKYTWWEYYLSCRTYMYFNLFYGQVKY